LTIKIPKPNDLQALFVRAKNDADTHGISYSGDIQSGNASGMGFEGHYAVDSDYIVIHVQKKPLFVSNAKIETEVKKYIGG
jgi:hypothetical protein